VCQTWNFDRNSVRVWISFCSSVDLDWSIRLRIRWRLSFHIPLFHFPFWNCFNSASHGWASLIFERINCVLEISYPCIAARHLQTLIRNLHCLLLNWYWSCFMFVGSFWLTDRFCGWLGIGVWSEWILIFQERWHRARWLLADLMTSCNSTAEKRTSDSAHKHASSDRGSPCSVCY
jgi:hypothetical protein